MVDQKFRKNEVVVRKGQDKGAFYVVLRGSMKVTEIAVGDQTFDDVVLMPGDFFGEHALIMSKCLKTIHVMQTIFFFVYHPISVFFLRRTSICESGWS